MVEPENVVHEQQQKNKKQMPKKYQSGDHQKIREHQ
jgi:hypothetical protein